MASGDVQAFDTIAILSFGFPRRHPPIPNVDSSPKDPASRRCSVCGHPYVGDVRFCQSCGSIVDRDDNEPTLTGQLVDGRYRVMEVLGEGAMGQVYRAEQVQMGRECALKVMKASELSERDAIQRFRREAASAARIVHPNVAAVYDFGGLSIGGWYLAMEFVAGRPLRKWIDDSRGLSPERAVEIAAQIADGLAGAHALDIVHRDLKPDNVIVADRPNGTVLAKIIDFGIAKRPTQEGGTLTTTGMVVGTPLYMSPEQFDVDAHIDGRSDLFALGLLLFEMLTGERPYLGTSLPDAMRRLVDPPRSLAKVRPDIAWSPSLQRAIDTLLAMDPKDRPASGSEAAAMLLEAVPGAAAMRQRGSSITVTPTPAASQPAVAKNADSQTVDRPAMWGKRAWLSLGVAAVMVGAGWQRLAVRGDDAAPRDPSPDNAVVTPEPQSTGTKRVVVTDSIRLLQSLLYGASVDVQMARVGKTRALQLLPFATATEDSSKLLFLALQADLVQEDSVAICASLARLEPIAPGTSSAEGIRPIREMFPCKGRGTSM